MESTDTPPKEETKEEKKTLVRAHSFARRDALDLDQLRVEASELANVLSKEHALATTRLFHAMESLLQRECHRRDRELADTRAELERARLQAELDRLARRHTLDDIQRAASETAVTTVSRGQTKRRTWA